MKQKSGILAFILSAVVLWILSMDFVPFIEIGFGGTVLVTIFLVALVLGIINFIIVALLRRLFKKGSAAIMFVVALIIDAFALVLTSMVMGSRFSIAFWPHAIIVAAILAAVCSLTGLVK
ncbi:MAG: phage holin family protein [Defluviitaleaceae bacterium]|nr:phage holin family protein [Defluviitaleaceae bacterium]